MRGGDRGRCFFLQQLDLGDRRAAIEKQKCYITRVAADPFSFILIFFFARVAIKN